MTTKTWLESPPSDHKRVIVNKLTNGHKSAKELQSLLKNLRDGSMTSRYDELAMEIVTSFDQILSVFSEARLLMISGGGDDQQCSNYGGGGVVKAEQSHVDHSHCGDRGLEDSGESKKRPPGAKDRRGCYKRRKNLESWTKVTSTIEDGQAWRKYGQKEILNAKYPRAYFRCTRKKDQGCQATKQVQQIQDAPEKAYETTYIGNHSCKAIKIPHMIIDASNPSALESHDAPPRATSSSESESVPVKKEETLTSSGVTQNGNDMWPEFDFELPEGEANVMSDEDVVSNMQFLEMHLVKSIDFYSEFDFDQVAFPLGP